MFRRLTFLEPEGAGSKIRVCISDGKAEYTGRMMRSGTSGPVRNNSTSPAHSKLNRFNIKAATLRLCLSYILVHVVHIHSSAKKHNNNSCKLLLPITEDCFLYFPSTCCSLWNLQTIVRSWIYLLSHPQPLPLSLVHPHPNPYPFHLYILTPIPTPFTCTSSPQSLPLPLVHTKTWDLAK
jgi:hypothetical protein